MSQDVLAEVSATGPRRALGVVVMGLFGALLAQLALTTPGLALGFQVALLGLGAVSLYVAVRMWQVTQLTLELTAQELRLSDGTVLARVDQIEAIDRGAFAFKPSHGFMIKLAQPGKRAWHPGLWWRLGRRVGVGGVTPGGQTRAMADIISAMVSER